MNSHLIVISPLVLKIQVDYHIQNFLFTVSPRTMSFAYHPLHHVNPCVVVLIVELYHLSSQSRRVEIIACNDSGVKHFRYQGSTSPISLWWSLYITLLLLTEYHVYYLIVEPNFQFFYSLNFSLPEDSYSLSSSSLLPERLGFITQ